MIPVENLPHQRHRRKQLLLLRAQPHRAGSGFVTVVKPAGADQLCLIFLHGCQHTLVGVRLQPVVTVHKGDIIPPGNVNSRITGIAQAAVLFVNHPHPTVLGGVFVADFTAAVRRTVIHQNDLQGTVGLIQN